MVDVIIFNLDLCLVFYVLFGVLHSCHRRWQKFLTIQKTSNQKNHNQKQNDLNKNITYFMFISNTIYFKGKLLFVCNYTRK